MVQYALVVDDDPSARRLMMLSLASHGWHVAEASHGASALSRLADVPSGGLVVVDLMLGDQLGTEVIMQMRTVREDVRFLLVSGSDVELTLIGESVDADVVHKPIDLARFPEVAAVA